MSPEEKRDMFKLVFFIWTNVVLIIGVAVGFWHGKRWPR